MTKAALKLFLIVFLTICSGISQTAYGQKNEQNSNSESNATTSNGQRTGHTGGSFAERNPRYKVQRDDVLALTFPLSPELNQTVTVQPDGYVDLQGGESIHIQGMSVPEIVAEIKKAYAHVLNEPIVNVSITDYQKPFFVVSGQVAKPGQYFMRYDMTVAEAIAVGGGLTPGAKTQAFLFRKDTNNWAQVRELKLNDLVNGKSGNEDLLVKPGDMIYVPEKLVVKFRKYVPYGIGMSLSPNIFY